MFARGAGGAGGAGATKKPRNRLDSNPDFGWGYIMTFLRLVDVLPLSAVSVTVMHAADSLKRIVRFTEKQLVLERGDSVTIGRVGVARIRFPQLEDVSVNLSGALRWRNGFYDDACRAPILAKVFTFTFVMKLDLYNNNIAVVPDAIGGLTNLKYLNLGYNKIRTLPVSICRLMALETLYLNSNLLVDVPDEISCLRSLTILWLCENQIATVPDWIGGMVALTSLDLSENKIATLPPTISGLTALTKLSVTANNLVGLPDSIGQLTGLKVLHLGDQLTALPDSIIALTNLKWLELVVNKFAFRILRESAEVQVWLQALHMSSCLLNFATL